MPMPMLAAAAGLAQAVRGLARDLGDLALDRRCMGCGRDAGVLCPSCAGRLWQPPDTRQLAVRAWFAAEHEGLARRLLLEHKEHGLRALTPVLSELLAGALDAAMDAAVRGPRPAWAVVPIPPHRASVRRRGRDSLHEIAAGAVRLLRAQGHDCRLERTLAWATEISRHTGSSARARRSMGRALTARPLGARAGAAIVVDDVITTGATADEAVRALGAAGVRVHAVAAVASRSLAVR